MAIDFTLTEKQREIQESAREFAREHLAPITDRVDVEPDPLKAFQLMKDAYAEACRRGFAFSMLPGPMAAADSRTSTSCSPPRRFRP